VAAPKAGEVTSTSGVVPIIVTGAKSATGSKLRRRATAGLTPWVEAEATSSTWPSGSERITASDATAPFAPARFSTITDWPMTGPSASARSRAATSVEPPGAKGTINRRGRSGKARATVASARLERPARTRRREGMAGTGRGETAPR